MLMNLYLTGFFFFNIKLWDGFSRKLNSIFPRPEKKLTVSCKSCARDQWTADTLSAAIHTVCKGLWMRDEK